jgi:TRAP-type C4-dicarboxylate transport system permease small subunit
MMRLTPVVERLSRVMVRAGGAIVLAAAVLIGVEVVIRRFAGFTVGGIDELSGYTLAISSSWAFGFALLQKAHVRIDTVYLMLPPRLRPLLDVAALCILGWFAGLVAWYGFDLFQLSVAFRARAMTPLATPLWIPQGLWLAGWAAFLAVIALLLAQTLGALLRGRADEALRASGLMTVEEELKEELGDIERRRAVSSGAGGSGAGAQ